MSGTSSIKGRLRIAVLGAGQHSVDHHGPGLKRVRRQYPDGVELAAVCDKDEAKARSYAEQFSFARVYTDLDEMLAAETIDGLVVITPVALTASIAAELLPRRIPLLIEKPPGQNPDETRHLVKLAEQYKTPNMVSFNRRFNPALVRAKQWLADNVPDQPPQLAVARMLRHNRTEPAFVVDTGIHLVDATNCLMGRPTRVTTHNRDRVWASHIKFESGGAANIVIAPQTGVSEEIYELIGPDYSLRIDTSNCRLTVFEGGQASVDWQCPDDEESCFRDGAAGETEHFIEAIRQGHGFSPTLHDALLSMLTAEAIFNRQSCKISPD